MFVALFCLCAMAIRPDCSHLIPTDRGHQEAARRVGSEPPQATHRIAAIWGAICARFVSGGKIAAKKGLTALMRAPKSGFDPLF